MSEAVPNSHSANEPWNAADDVLKNLHKLADDIHKSAIVLEKMESNSRTSSGRNSAETHRSPVPFHQQNGHGRSRVEQLATELAAKDQQIRALQATVRQNEAQMASFKLTMVTRVAEKDQQIRDLNKEVGVLLGRAICGVNFKLRQLEELAEHNEETQKTIQMLQDDISNLKQRLGKLESSDVAKDARLSPPIQTTLQGKVYWLKDRLTPNFNLFSIE